MATAPTMQPGTIVTTQINALAAYVDDTRVGVLGRGKRQSASSTTTTEVGVLRLDDIPIVGGHLYRIYTSGLIFASTVVNDVVRVYCRYTTNGSTPTTSSTQLTAVQQSFPASAFPNVVPLVAMYAPAGNEILSLILTVARLGGTGNVSLAWSAGFDIDLVCEDCGPDSGDVGVDL